MDGSENTEFNRRLAEQESEKQRLRSDIDGYHITLWNLRKLIDKKIGFFVDHKISAEKIEELRTMQARLSDLISNIEEGVQAKLDLDSEALKEIHEYLRVEVGRLNYEYEHMFDPQRPAS